MTLATDIFAAPSAFVPAADTTICAHCGSAVPAGLIDRSALEQFCCAGCQAVYSTLHACGLDDYYRLRAIADGAARPASPKNARFESFDSPTFHARYVQTRSDGLSVVDLALEGVSCAACVWLVERLPRVLSGVVEARLSLREAIVRMTWDGKAIPLSRVGIALNRLGYTPFPARSGDAQEIHRRETRRRLIAVGIAGAIMGNSMLLALALYAGDFGHMEPVYRVFFRCLSAIFGLASLAGPGAAFFKSAIAAARARTTNLDIPIALALAVGGVAGLINVALNRGEIYFDSLTVLVFLLLVGRFIQYRQQRRANDAVGLLFSLTPSTCHRVEPDAVQDVPIEAVRAGDLVEVRAGELFPVDGVVESGKSSVNQALLTGESTPSAVDVGGEVHAGSQNIASMLRVRASRVGAETRVGELMQLIERGLRDKPAIVQLADRVGGYFVVVLCCVSAAVFAYWARVSVPQAIDHTVALLIVTCPCVLGLTTPLTIAIAIGRLARQDILVKSGAVLERLSRGGRLLLDKTGTITAGKMEMVQWAGDSRWQPIVAQLERHSNHPIGRTLYDALAPTLAGQTVLPAVEVVEIVESGNGGVSGVVGQRSVSVGSPRFAADRGVLLSPELLQAQQQLESAGATAVIVAVENAAVAVAGLADRIRDDSRSAIQRLRKQGFDIAVLSGDAPSVVAKVAAEVGIAADDAIGAMTPEDKLARVAARTDGGSTVMVGDGVNDAAALAGADVGIAVHGGAEASLSAADVYMARPGLSPLVTLVDMSRRTMRTVRRNLVISLGYNLLAGSFAAAGLMTPLHAAILMPISSASVLALAVISVGGFSWRITPHKAQLIPASGGLSWK